MSAGMILHHQDSSGARNTPRKARNCTVRTAKHGPLQVLILDSSGYSCHLGGHTWPGECVPASAAIGAGERRWIATDSLDLFIGPVVKQDFAMTHVHVSIGFRGWHRLVLRQHCLFGVFLFCLS